MMVPESFRVWHRHGESDLIEHTLGEVMSQCEMTITSNYVLTVPNPDDPFAPPIYIGDPAKAHEVLIPGRYSAIIENWAIDAQAELNIAVTVDSTVLGRFVLVGESR